jgi:N-acetylneuraminate synthase/N,N'-diacetyllegionaminate synthase
MQPVRAGTREIGPGRPCFIAVEVGLNHNGDVDLAHRLIDAAADAKVDAVKFQTYRTEDFVTDRTTTYEYVSAGTSVVEPQYDMFKRYELPGEAWPELRDHCTKRDVLFFSTPTGYETLDTLVQLGVPLLKNGSDYLGHLPLIAAMARTGIPTVLATGMATEDEVAESVDAFVGAGGRELVLLHCTSSYPTKPEDVHLRKIPALAARFDYPVGLSDHTDGVVAAIGAVAIGACFLEKHFTLDRDLPGPDHRFSTDPAELAELVRAVREVEVSLGSDALGPTESELVGRREYRLSCVAARPLLAGAILDIRDVTFRRPGDGIPPSQVESIAGRRLREDIPAGAQLQIGQLADV